MPNDILVKIISKLLRVGSSEKLAKILKNSTVEEIQSLLSSLDESQKSLLMNRLEPDEVADVIRKMGEETSQKILNLLTPERKAQIAKLLSYTQGTAGAIMNPSFFTLSQNISINEAIEILRAKKQVEVVFYLYVVDDNNHLVGIISLRQLILSKGDIRIGDIMNKNVIAVDIRQSQEEVARLISRNNFLAVPVVDEEKHLVGIITVDDVIDVIQEEANQDLYKMLGVEKDERVSTPIKSSIQKRAPWLLINLGTAILAAQVVSLFEGTIQKVVLLATFMPVVAGMGGNAGNQTLAIMIRAIALGEVALKKARKVLIKEISVGVVNGVLTGLAIAIVAYYWKGNPILGLVLMIAMIGNLFVSSIVGVLVPLCFRALKIDPAIASTVILTTFTDCFGFFFFLGLATLLMNYLL